MAFARRRHGDPCAGSRLLLRSEQTLRFEQRPGIGHALLERFGRPAPHRRGDDGKRLQDAGQDFVLRRIDVAAAGISGLSYCGTKEFCDADADFTGAALQPLVKGIVNPDCDPCQGGRSIRSFSKEAKTRGYYSADPPESQ